MQNTGKLAVHMDVVKSDIMYSERSMIRCQNRPEGTITSNKTKHVPLEKMCGLLL